MIDYFGVVGTRTTDHENPRPRYVRVKHYTDYPGLNVSVAKTEEGQALVAMSLTLGEAEELVSDLTRALARARQG